MENIFRVFSRAIMGVPLLDSMMADFSRMMLQLSRMYNSVASGVFSGKHPKPVDARLYREDIFINKSERLVRKKVLEHLSFQSRPDISASVILLNVVKDAERIGDYCKNMNEVARMFRKFGPRNPHYKALKAMSDAVARLIGRTEKAFRKSLEDECEDILEKAHQIGEECDDLLAKLANSRMPANDAVCLALLTRHIKRVASHLGNISSTVIMPVHKMDYAVHRQPSKKDVWVINNIKRMGGAKRGKGRSRK